MSYSTLEEAFRKPSLTAATLRRFRKPDLQHLCDLNLIAVPSRQGQKILKESYVQALLQAKTAAAGRKGRSGPGLGECLTSTDGKIVVRLSPKLKLKLTDKRRRRAASGSDDTVGEVTMEVEKDDAGMEVDAGGTPVPSPIQGPSRQLQVPTSMDSTNPPDARSPSPLQSVPALDNADISCAGSADVSNTVLTQLIGSANAIPSTIAIRGSKRQRYDDAVSRKPKKSKTGNKSNESQRTITVKAYHSRDDEFHTAEAEMRLDSNGGLAVDYVAARLQLKGRFYVIHPKNRYIYESTSPHIVNWDEIQELQDFRGNLLVTFNEHYSKSRRERKDNFNFS